MVSKHAQRDGWGALTSQYGRRVSPSASSSKGELTSAGRLQQSKRCILESSVGIMTFD